MTRGYFLKIFDTKTDERRRFLKGERDEEFRVFVFGLDPDQRFSGMWPA